MRSEFEVIVVGQSIAAYITAVGFAAEGKRIAFVSEQPFPRPDMLLPTCFLLPRTVNHFKQIGLGADLQTFGNLQNSLVLWTPAGPVHSPERAAPSSLHIRRFQLHDLLQRKLRSFASVQFFSDYKLLHVIERSGRIYGITLRSPAGKAIDITANLVVAADGFYSQVASLAEVPERRFQNGRFGYYAYVKVDPENWSQPTMWLNDPDVAFLLPDEPGLALALAMPTRDKQVDFGRHVTPAFLDYFATLPNGPPLTRSFLQSPSRPVVQNDIISRPAVFKQMALTGTAALANDPIWCLSDSWSADSAFLLIKHLKGRLNNPAALQSGLRRYARAKKQLFQLPQRWMANYASGRRFNFREHWLLNAAVYDPITAKTIHAILHGEMHADALVQAYSVLRIGTANAQRAARRTTRFLESYTS